jgi:hypothetical protein
MEFWALEDASDDLLIAMAVVIIGFFVIGGIVVLIDHIKQKRNE